ncbi:hypothetical protein Nepgr_008108 [Nepenthes gracilis]|uniref:Uncharacterized protein n=1 Tax=Nepenthes gracilis TaxID=150966 RepID=A0AAD3XIY1_NEPGR|nr:hypothetical protein Nepgr_008108 [Nepenthes gracilis]
MSGGTDEPIRAPALAEFGVSLVKEPMTDLVTVECLKTNNANGPIEIGAATEVVDAVEELNLGDLALEG